MTIFRNGVRQLATGATIFIAASDASDLSKSKASVVCTGTNDYLIIQAANDAASGGTVAPAIAVLILGITMIAISRRR